MVDNSLHEKFMRIAIHLSEENVTKGLGGPFGAVIVKDGKIIGESANTVNQNLDPTAHAEIAAIRLACKNLNTIELTGAIIYTSCEPCPMCLAAMHLCGIERAWFAYSNEDGEPYGLSTAAVYAQMARPPQQQSLPLSPLKPAGEQGLYAAWRQVQG